MRFPTQGHKVCVQEKQKDCECQGARRTKARGDWVNPHTGPSFPTQEPCLLLIGKHRPSLGLWWSTLEIQSLGARREVSTHHESKAQKQMQSNKTQCSDTQEGKQSPNMVCAFNPSMDAGGSLQVPSQPALHREF